MTKRIQEPRVRTLLRLLGLPARPPSAGEPGARLARAVARHHGPLPDRVGRRIERLVELRHRAGRWDRNSETVFVLPPWLAADWHVVGTTAGPYAPDPDRCLDATSHRRHRKGDTPTARSLPSVEGPDDRLVGSLRRRPPSCTACSASSRGSTSSTTAENTLGTSPPESCSVSDRRRSAARGAREIRSRQIRSQWLVT